MFCVNEGSYAIIFHNHVKCCDILYNFCIMVIYELVSVRDWKVSSLGDLRVFILLVIIRRMKSTFGCFHQVQQITFLAYGVLLIVLRAPFQNSLSTYLVVSCPLLFQTSYSFISVTLVLLSHSSSDFFMSVWLICSTFMLCTIV